MPGSQTAPGRTVLSHSRRPASPSDTGTSSAARNKEAFAAQWLAYAPCRRFALDLTIDCARLGAGGVRTFTVKDFHLMLLAGLPTHCGTISFRPKPVANEFAPTIAELIL